MMKNWIDYKYTRFLIVATIFFGDRGMMGVSGWFVTRLMRHRSVPGW